MDYLVSGTKLNIGIIAFFLCGLLLGIVLSSEPQNFETQRQKQYLKCVSDAYTNNHPEILRECKNIIK